MKIPDAGALTTTMGVLVIATNALTELFKGMFPKMPAQITATVIALVLTICTVGAYLTVTGMRAEWYIVVGAAIAGFFVSYTAQFGYDKAKETVKLIGGKK